MKQKITQEGEKNSAIFLDIGFFFPLIAAAV